MLLALHRSLQRLIYEYGKVDQREVDISFDMPTRESIDRLTRPTIYLFLHSIQENFDARQSSVSMTPGNNGHAIRQWHFRPFYLHYLVTVLTTEIEDAYQLVWRALETLVRYPQLPAEVLDTELVQMSPLPLGSILQDTVAQNLSGIWSSLSLPPYPSFSYVVTVPVQMAPLEEVPLVLRSTTRYTSSWTQSEESEASHRIGGVVQDRQGTPLEGVKITLAGSTMEYRTNNEGQFVVPYIPPGPVRLFVAREHAKPQSVSIAVSEKNVRFTSYTIVLNSDTESEA